MAKFLSKLYVKVIISAAVGLFLAGAFTHIQYPCISSVPGEGCVVFEKAAMHPSDLINNKQNSLTKLVGTFAVSSLVSFALLSVYSRFQTKKKI